jgi:hypothetical protein
LASQPEDLLLLGSGSTHQYLKAQILPKIGMPPPNLVDVPSQLAGQLLVATGFTADSKLALLAMSSTRFNQVDFDSLGALKDDAFFEVLVGRYRPWIAIGGGNSKAARDSVFTTLLNDSANRGNETCDEDQVPLVSIASLRHFLRPAPNSPPHWAIWITADRSGTLREFNKYLGDDKWPPSAQHYERAGLYDVVRTKEPWIAIGNEFLNRDQDTSTGAPICLNDKPGVRVFFLTARDTNRKAPARRGELFLYGRVQSASQLNPNRYELPAAVREFLERILAKDGMLVEHGISNRELEGQRKLFHLGEHARDGHGFIQLPATHNIIEGWSSNESHPRD